MFRRDIFPYPREKDMPSTYWFCLTVFGDETNAMLSHRQHVPGSCLCLKIWLLHWIILTFSYITQYIIFSRVWLPDCHSNELPSTPKLLKTANRKSQATCGTTWIREDWIFCALWALSKKSRDLISYPSCPKDMKWSWKSQWTPLDFSHLTDEMRVVSTLSLSCKQRDPGESNYFHPFHSNSTSSPHGVPPMDHLIHMWSFMPKV